MRRFTASLSAILLGLSFAAAAAATPALDAAPTDTRPVLLLQASEDLRLRIVGDRVEVSRTRAGEGIVSVFAKSLEFRGAPERNTIPREGELSLRAFGNVVVTTSAGLELRAQSVLVSQEQGKYRLVIEK